MPLDPSYRPILDKLAASGVLPLSQWTPAQAREIYRQVSFGRRGADFVSEQVGSVEHRVVPGPAGDIPIRVYTPLEDRGRVLTFIHGGGWVIGDLDTHDPQARRIANAVGAVVVSVDYRRAPEHPYPAPLDDVMAALHWTAANYPDRPHVVGGDSAGGNLSAAAALRARDEGPALAAQLLIYPAVDPSASMPSVAENAEGYFLTGADLIWFLAHYLPDPSMRTQPTADLINADLAGLPPTVIATAEFDPLRDEGDAYANRLRDAGVEVRHFPGPGQIHGFFAFAPGVPSAAELRQDLLAALADLLDASPS